MPPGIDPGILHAVHTVYSTDLGLPEDWTDAQRTAFLEREADDITWMARAHAATLGDLRIQQWSRGHGGHDPNPSTRAVLRAQARAEALRQVLNTELYELIADDFDR